jgi:DNA-binding MarR family transcriptional regulator
MRRSSETDHSLPVDRKTHTPSGAAFTRLVLDLFRLNGRMIASGDRMGADLGMTSARWQVLGAVGSEPKTVAAAARAMGLTRQNVQRIADWLVESGLAEYVDNPNHRRAKLVALTPKGAAMRVKLHRRQVKWANEIGLQLTVKELETTIDVLKRLQRLA